MSSGQGNSAALRRRAGGASLPAGGKQIPMNGVKMPNHHPAAAPTATMVNGYPQQQQQQQQGPPGSILINGTYVNPTQMSIQQVFMLFDQRIRKLEQQQQQQQQQFDVGQSSVQSFSPQQQQSNAIGSSYVSIEQFENELNEMKDRFNGLVEVAENLETKTNEMQNSVLKLQEYTMDVNKSLFSQIMEKCYLAPKTMSMDHNDDENEKEKEIILSYINEDTVISPNAS